MSNDFEIAAGRIAVFVLRGDAAKFALLRDRVDPRREWDGGRRAWIFPDTKANRERLGIDADGESAGEIASKKKTVGAGEPPQVSTPRRPASHATISDYSLSAIPWPGQLTPFAHQVVGRELVLRNEAFLLAWEMGLGKTAVIAAALAYERQGPTLVVCPRVMLHVWPDELFLHGGLHSLVIDGDPAKRKELTAKIGERTIAVTSYDLMIRDFKQLFPIHWDRVVADEIHRAKNATSRTSKTLRKIAEGETRSRRTKNGRRPVRQRWALSGTPAPNGPLDWFGPLLFLGEKHAGTPYKTVFEQRYAVYGRFIGPGIKQVVDYCNLDDLNARVAAVADRKTKAECLDLPPKIFRPIPVTLGKKARKVYDDLKREALARLESGGEITAENILVEIMRLLQVAGGWVTTEHPDGSRVTEAVGDNAKLDALADLCEDLATKAIVFCHFKTEAYAVAMMLGRRAVLHTGDDDAKDRKTAYAQFRDPSAAGAQFIVATTASMREGVTLTEAKAVIYYSRGYSLMDWLQSQDRAHRIGQTEPVEIFTLEARGTLDAKIAAALEKKENLQERMMTLPPSIASIADDAERLAAASDYLKGKARDLFS